MAQGWLHGQQITVSYKKRNSSGRYYLGYNRHHGLRRNGKRNKNPFQKQKGQKPTKDSANSIVVSIGGTTANYKSVKQSELIRIISPKIRGWANYYRHSAASMTFALLSIKCSDYFGNGPIADIKRKEADGSGQHTLKP